MFRYTLANPYRPHGTFCDTVSYPLFNRAYCVTHYLNDPLLHWDVLLFLNSFYALACEIVNVK